ncbi:hypothetical protein KY329_02615 [Candidatus Woesearchaeota archaeon]|nr:hypothetical protein [Candidatus Woesearchaeota archaeon]
MNPFLESFTNPLLAIWQGIVQSVPGIVAAILILIFGYIIAVLLGRLVSAILVKINADKWLLHKTNLKKLFGDFKLSRFLALITKWYVFVLFLPPAAEVIRLQSLAVFLIDVAKWIPNVILGVIIAFVGILAADYVAHMITETKAKAAGVLGLIAKIVILVFTALIVFNQIGIKIQVAETSFLIVIAGIMLGLALMFGIGFGLAMKEEAKASIKKIKKKF